MVPMVSFCDIPMSEIKDHISKYGCYGIGLSQEWGRRKGLNPVLYVDRGSSVGVNYYNAYLEITKGKKVQTLSDLDANLLDVIRYMKNYECDLTRKGEVVPNYRFADEKEWRYVSDKDDTLMLIAAKHMEKEGAREALDDKTKELFLEFEPEDIKYIIVKDDSEISEFMDVLRRAKSKFQFAHVERLITRIITTEQIMLDF